MKKVIDLDLLDTIKTPEGKAIVTCLADNGVYIMRHNEEDFIPYYQLDGSLNEVEEA